MSRQPAASPAGADRGRRPTTPVSLGPIADLESHLPEEWWRQLFDSLYLMTDGDVVESVANTRHEIDLLLEATGAQPTDRIIDLCCGQGRHALELARRGFRSVTGIDRSRYLVRLARRRAAAEKLPVAFREADARAFRVPEGSQDMVCILGNSFGYFSDETEDSRVLAAVARALRSGGTLVLDITDGDWMRERFDARTWEWIDKNHFVCRERSLSSDGQRLVSREVIVHDDRGVIADQFYAERLYSESRLRQLLDDAGFHDIRRHAVIEGQSTRGQDLGMMGRRMLLSAAAPRRQRPLRAGGRRSMDVAVLLGDPRLPDAVKRGGRFNDEDIDTVDRLKDALAELSGYRFRYLDNHATLRRDILEGPLDFAFNLCDEGWNNDAFKELHVPAMLEADAIPYTGAGPACLAMCYDKGLVRAVAQSLDIPVPLETYVRPGDHSATLPSVFPVILKPNFGDSSIGITKDAVVDDQSAVLDYLIRLRESRGDGPVLVQEFLTGAEYSVCLIGNTAQGLRPLSVLEVDYSGLDTSLPRILGYESKWEPDSAYWNTVRYKPAVMDEGEQAAMVEAASRLFERLGCRDYARFDFRAAADGTVKLLEVNPNPGWSWDGKMNLMAGFAGRSYSDMLAMILDAARDRLRLPERAALPASPAN